MTLHPLAPLAAILALAVPVALLRWRSLAFGALTAVVGLTWAVRLA